MPYDPPTQDAWQRASVKGWPGYKVADTVKTHEAWGLGIYCVFKQDNIYADNAVERYRRFALAAGISPDDGWTVNGPAFPSPLGLIE